MTVTDASHRTAAPTTSRRTFDAAARSPGKEALAALQGALRRSPGSSTSPEDLPAVRLHGSAGRQLLDSDEEAIAKQAADRAEAAAAAVERGAPIGPVEAFAKQAQDAAAAASRAAVAAAQAARGDPGNAALARAAQETREVASRTMLHARRAQAARLSAYRSGAQEAFFHSVNAAEAANATANTAIEAAADRLAAAGADPATVAALRALRCDTANALHTSDGAVADAVLDQGIQAAEAAGDADAAAALRAAKSVRASAGKAAAAAANARGAYQQARLLEVHAGFMDGLQNAPSDVPAAFGALNRRRGAADLVQDRAQVVAEALRDARDHAAAAAQDARDAGLIPVAGQADPLQAEEPVGEPAGLDIGSTTVTIEAENLGKRLWSGIKAGLSKALPFLGPMLLAAGTEEFFRGLYQAVQADLNNKDRKGTATRAYLIDTLSGMGGSIAAAAAGGRAGPVGAIAGAVAGFFGGRAAGRGIAAGGGNSATRAIDMVVQDVIRHQIDKAFEQEARNALPLPAGARVVQAGSTHDAHANVEELRKGLAATGLKVSASDEQLAWLVAAYGSTGSGAMSAEDIDRAIEDGALRHDGQGGVTVDPFAFTINLDSSAQHPLADNVAARVVALGSQDEDDDKLLNTGELMGALKDAGYALGADEGRFERLVAAYDRSGDGALDEREIAQALKDDALVIATDGTVWINDICITGLTDNTAVAIGLRVVKAGAGGDLLSTADDLDKGLEAAGYDPRLGDDDYAALIAHYGDPATRLIGPEGITQAIVDGALVIDADGKVTRNKAVQPN